MTTVAVRQRVLGEALQGGSGPFEGQLVDRVALEAGDTLRITVPQVAQPIQPPSAQTAAKKVRVLWPLLALVGVALAGWVIPFVLDRGLYGAAATAVAGVSVFAGIYAGAQVIERLLEPLSLWIKPNESSDKEYGEAVEAADKAITAWAKRPDDAQLKEQAEVTMKTMAEKKNAVDEKKDDRTAIFWGIASIVGMGASAGFGLFLLKLIGVSASYGWDVFATGLILGSGTKPVHEIITKVSKASSDDSKQEGGSATSAKP
jgi:hypothetical protein